jgi:hypothetical protein
VHQELASFTIRCETPFATDHGDVLLCRAGLRSGGLAHSLSKRRELQIEERVVPALLRPNQI